MEVDESPSACSADISSRAPDRLWDPRPNDDPVRSSRGRLQQAHIAQKGRARPRPRLRPLIGGATDRCWVVGWCDGRSGGGGEPAPMASFDADAEGALVPVLCFTFCFFRDFRGLVSSSRPIFLREVVSMSVRLSMSRLCVCRGSLVARSRDRSGLISANQTSTLRGSKHFKRIFLSRDSCYFACNISLCLSPRASASCGLLLLSSLPVAATRSVVLRRPDVVIFRLLTASLFSSPWPSRWCSSR